MDAKVTLSITSLSTHIEYAPLKYNDGEILIQKQSIFINHPDYTRVIKADFLIIHKKIQSQELDF